MSIQTYLASLPVQVGIATLSSLLIRLKNYASTAPEVFFFFPLIYPLTVPILPLSGKLVAQSKPKTTPIAPT